MLPYRLSTMQVQATCMPHPASCLTMSDKLLLLSTAPVHSTGTTQGKAAQNQ